MTEPAPQLVDTEAVAAWYGVARGTVRYWASTQRWTRYGTRSSRLWDLREIEKIRAERGQADTA